jgi:SSS family transporter
MSSTLVAVLAFYFGTVVVIGIRGYRKTRSEDDFLTASRTIGPWVGGAVLAATQISAGTFVGTVGRHYSAGVSWAWIWLGVWCGWVLSAVLVAPKLRAFGACTIPDFLAARFNSRVARALSAILIIFGYSILLIAQYQACGEIFQAIFGLPPIYAMAALVASTLIYTSLGGVRSSSYIDFLQTLIMISGLVLAVPILIHQTGGFGVTGRYLHSLDARLTGWWYGGRELLAYSLSFGLTMAAAPYEMVRYYSMRDKQTVRYAIGVCLLFQAIIGGCVLIIGVFMRMLYPNLASADQASSILALNLLSPIAGSLFIVAMMSAIMSTCNSILLVMGSALAHDIYGMLINPRAPEKQRLMITRASIIALGLVPVWFALQKYGDVQSIVVMETKFIASTFFIPVVLGLNSRKGTPPAAIASMAGGGLACLAWSLTGERILPALDATEVGIAVSALMYLGVSRFTRPVPRGNLEAFFP